MGGKQRGQTSLDFAAGMSAFLLVVAFSLSFIPGMLQPFTASGQEETAVADRVADQLAEGMLGDPSSPYQLDVDCTEAFFDDSESDSGCKFSNDEPLRERLGLANKQDIHIQLLDSDSTGALEIGTAPVPETDSVIVARRTIRVGTDVATLLVRVW